MPKHSSFEGDNVLHIKHHYDVGHNSAPAYYKDRFMKRTRQQYFDDNKPKRSHEFIDNPTSGYLQKLHHSQKE